MEGGGRVRIEDMIQRELTDTYTIPLTPEEQAKLREVLEEWRDFEWEEEGQRWPYEELLSLIGDEMIVTHPQAMLISMCFEADELYDNPIREKFGDCMPSRLPS